jgi:hypothetical protein
MPWSSWISVCLVPSIGSRVVSLGWCVRKRRGMMGSRAWAALSAALSGAMDPLGNLCGLMCALLTDWSWLGQSRGSRRRGASCVAGVSRCRMLSLVVFSFLSLSSLSLGWKGGRAAPLAQVNELAFFCSCESAMRTSVHITRVYVSCGWPQPGR